MFQDSLINNKNKAREAYTLLEILVATAIFGIIATTIALPLINSMSLSAKDRDIVEANALARKFLKDTEILWQDSDNFMKEPASIDSSFTKNGKYNVFVDAVNGNVTNALGDVVVRRVNVTYRNQQGEVLSNLYLDYSKF